MTHIYENFFLKYCISLPDFCWTILCIFPKYKLLFSCNSMAENHPKQTEFLEKCIEIIHDHISNEQFGVSELAAKLGMSRSNLLRKIRKDGKVSASQFIRQVRLQKAMKMLSEESFNVSEISFKVGFGSTSYFIKCFREYYGYPPGEAGKMEFTEPVVPESKSKRWSKLKLIIPAGLIIPAIVLAGIYYFMPFTKKNEIKEKSIAVLPFINDSNDSSNVYIINGLMESVLTNLQKVEDLRVVSRTSVEKYREVLKSIPEMANELNVNYFVEGSGQKIDDKILLTIQLIDARTDKHLWSEQYTRQAKDIFQLQMEVAKAIANEIEAIITPEEAARIEQSPTDNLIAYDYYLQGMNHFYIGNREGLNEAIEWFTKATEEDPQFARAYANIAIAYYYSEIFQKPKQFTDKINRYADLALLNDPKSEQGLIAKALYYKSTAEYKSAADYLENALEYSPNSVLILNNLSDLYANYIPNSGKYLEYALRGISLDIAASDSSTVSFTYLHISNAFAQNGFIQEADKYIKKSLNYYPDNLFSEDLRAYIHFAQNMDFQQTRNELIETLNKDTLRLDIMQEIGKICYLQRDYKCAYYYYSKYLDKKRALNWEIYPGEDAKIAFVMEKTGHIKEAEFLYQKYKDYAQNDKSIYQPLSMTVVYTMEGQLDLAMDQFRLFSEEKNFAYWIILFLDSDPLLEDLRTNPEYYVVRKNLEKNFRANHKKIRKSLETKGLI